MVNDRLRRDLHRYEKHLAKKFKQEVDKQRRKLFGDSGANGGGAGASNYKSSRHPESSYNQMIGSQSKNTGSKQQDYGRQKDLVRDQ